MSKKAPKLSIITVCYNNCEGLRKTMESVKTQTFKDYEYIVIDGGSTDGTVELIKENAKFPFSCGEGLGERLIDYWISEKDSGIYNAMNKGIKAAKGEYCYFLNSDDYIAMPNTLEKIFEQVKNNPDIIYGNLAIRKDNKLCYVSKFSKNITPYSFYRHRLAIHHQASFIKRELFEKYGLYSDKAKLISDWIFFFETVILHKVQTQYVNRVFAVFLAGGESSVGISEKHIKNELIQTYFSQEQIKKYAFKDKLFKVFRIRKAEKLLAKLFLLCALSNNQVSNKK